MHMMFVDESGDPGYPTDGDWARFGGSKFFCRVGVILHGWRWRVWNERLQQFKHNRGLTWDSEIKANHIRKGDGAFLGWDQNRRDLFLSDFTRLIGGNPNITLLGVAINKQRVNTTQKDRIVKPQIRSLELLLERYNMFLRHQADKCGIVVLDPVKEKSDDDLRYFQSYLLAWSEHLRPLHIVEGTFFAKSHTSNLIQVADVCSSIFYREKAGHRAGPYWAAIYPRFWRSKGRVAGVGIKEWP
jgi:hypothetical protein